MSDFDKRLSNMMNEEEHFPNMQKNWEKLSPHLQPPQPLKRASLQKRWLVGIAASLSVLAVSAMSYFLVTTHQENKALKNEVNNLKNNTQDIDNKIITHKNNILTDKPNNSENGAKNTLSTTENKVETEISASGFNGQKEVTSKSISPNKTVVSKGETITSSKIKTPPQQRNTILPIKRISKEAPSVFVEKKEDTNKKDVVQKATEAYKAQNEVLNPSKKLENNTPIVAFDNKKSDLNNTENNVTEPILNSETAAITMGKKTDLTVLPLGIILKPTFSNSTTTPLSIERALMPSPAIMRSAPRKGRFAIGVQAFTSFGDGEGRDKSGPALSGLGLVASYDLTRHFEIMASADLGGMRYDFRDKPRGNRIPKGPQEAPKDHPKFKGVSGKQDRQQFSIGLKYKIQTNTFLTPYLNVGYDLQRLGKQTCNFNFVNDTTNTEVSVQQVENPRIANNLWHAGIGLEAKVYSFIISASAEYQKDFSINNDNRVVLRGGIKYHF